MEQLNNLLTKQIRIMKHPLPASIERRLIKTLKGIIIFKVEVKGWDWKKIEMIDKKRLKGLKKQDWIDWEDKIEERLHQSYQSSSIYINLKNTINWGTEN